MSSEGDNSRDRSVRIPPLIMLVLGGLAVVIAFRTLSADLYARGFVSINTLRSTVLPRDERSELAGWIDPRWEHHLSLSLARFADVSAFDQAAIDGLVLEIEAEPFVAEVGQATVVWPDGLSVEIRFEQPVACLGVDGELLTVAQDGTVLPGPWASPPELEGAPLPILSAQPYSRADVRPGMALQVHELQDALSVANSLHTYLDPELRFDLGPIVIDASRAEEASLDVVGVVLDLEFGRRILFGRAPYMDAPGELPEHLKWNSVARAADALRDGLDWTLLDVRWDEPRYVSREGEEGSL